ncbi:hypothetical protein LPTSP3_g19850 [Leptospira kobayashii]|uniref:DUF819 family protein n=1 Tax=Leptospira kobayashii TaxID=1917830 RepID=A0ABN6KDI1_9LEPT|nr:DUF819 family protein [Leptospira kobayashii]BDA79055.1 hypothetical protein LPTSP3_g19850 [Leptospira kobayashii]
MEVVFSSIKILIILLALVGFPKIAYLLANRYRFFKILGPVILCYAAGILIGNIFPSGFWPGKIPELVADLSIPLAIPLLLASTDFLYGIKNTKTALISFALSSLAVAISTLLVARFLGYLHPESDKIAGMLAGLYTGGTPNLNALGHALDTNRSTIVLVNTVDVLVGGTYLVFLLSFSKRFFSQFLKPEPETEGSHATTPEPSKEENSLKGSVQRFLIGFVLSAIGFGISVGVSILLVGKLHAPIILLGITSWGIGISFVKKIRSLRTFPFGSYLILIFSVAVGALADFRSLVTDAPGVILFVAITMFGAILIHLLLGILFKIPTDTWIITSVSSIYGPAFVPPVTQAIEGKEGILLSGILTGLIGYGVGNYLGLAIHAVLQ